VFRLVFQILFRIPIEARFGHEAMVSRHRSISHIKVWLCGGPGRDP
jgi:hypothetical protein